MADIPRQSGVYCIKNTVNGKVYIGSAVNLKTRECQHRTTLVAGKHFNRYLQAAWKKYGPDAFRFEVLEFVPDKLNLTTVEQGFMDAHQSYIEDFGYNLRPKAESTLGMKMSEEVVERMRQSKIGKKQSPEHIANRMASIVSGGGLEKMRLANLGKKQSPDLVAKRMATMDANGGRERGRLALIGRKASPETRAKQSASLTGRKMSAEAVRKSAEARTGQSRPDIGQWAPEKFSMFTAEQVIAIRQDRATGMTYRAIAEKWGCNISTAHGVVNGKGAFYAKCA